MISNGKIVGIGGYLPGTPISTPDLIEKFQLKLDPDKVETVIGIKQRYWAAEGETTSDLAHKALKEALEDANLKATELNMIIVGTSTADHTNISCANRIQSLIGANCPAVDIVSACSSFIFALDYGLKSLSDAKHIAIIGADTKSKFVNKDDHRFLPIFGDGASAIILSQGELGRGFQELSLFSDGAHYADVLNPAGGSALPASQETVRKGLHATKITLEGKKMASLATKLLAEKVSDYLIQQKMGIQDIDYFVFHQANMVILRSVCSLLNIPEDKVLTSISNAGNTVAACLPLTLWQHKSVLKESNKTVLMATIGAGISGGVITYTI